MKKRILIVNDKMEIGGNTAALISLLRVIDQEKYQVDLLLYNHEGDLLVAIPEGIRLLPPAAMFQGKAGFFFRAAKLILSGYLFRAIRENRVHGYKGLSKQIMWDFQANVMSRPLKESYEGAISFFEGWADRYVAHRVSAQRKIGWLHSTFGKIAPIPELEETWMQKVNYIASVAEECKADFCRILPQFSDKAVCVENVLDSSWIRAQAKCEPVDDEKFSVWKRFMGFRIVTVCRLSIETKGLDRIALCAKQLKQVGYTFMWCIVGDGGDREALQRLIWDNDLSDCILLAGSRLNPYPFLSLGDVLCLPSRWEGKPLTVYESMILGVPPVVTRYLSAEEQIRHGVEGIIVENAEDTIFPAITALIDEPSGCNRMKEFLLSHEYGNVTPVTQIEQMLSGERI